MITRISITLLALTLCVGCGGATANKEKENSLTSTAQESPSKA